MKRLTLSLVAAVLLIAAAASAQLAPPPHPIVTTIDRVPMWELYDGGGGLPYLGSSTSYNAGDLSNYSAIDADNFTFGTHSRAEATDEVGTAIQPTLDLYNDAKSRGVAIFFITGRRENTRAHTEHNLQREGFTTWSQVVLKPDASTASTVAYKSAARAAIEDQGYRIIANVGDQYSDLAGGHAERAFKLANPFYFLP
jgi:hypothetical protein